MLSVRRGVVAPTGRTAVARESWHAVTAIAVVVVSVVTAWHYFPRHAHLFGEKYDSVIVGKKDLLAWAYLATLPGARDTLIGNANTDGTAWMYAVAGLHPLWTHYDYPVTARSGLPPVHLLGLRRQGGHRSSGGRGGEGAEHPVRGDERTGGPRVRHARRASVARQVTVVEEDLRQRQARIYEWRGEGT